MKHALGLLISIDFGYRLSEPPNATMSVLNRLDFIARTSPTKEKPNPRFGDRGGSNYPRESYIYIAI